MPSQAPARDRSARSLRVLRALARWLDSAVRVPGTRWRVGLDPVLGVIPVVGDLAGLALALLIIVAAWRLGAGARTLAWMLCHTIADTLIGAIPVVGDVYDVFSRTNERNVRALERALTAASDETLAGSAASERV